MSQLDLDICRAMMVRILYLVHSYSKRAHTGAVNLLNQQVQYVPA